MALQPRLSLLPPGATLLSPELAVAREDGEVILFNGGGPVLSFREDDAEGRRLAAAVISQPTVNLAPPKAVAEGLGISRTMLFKYRRRYAEGGPAALVTRRSGPKGPHKLEGEKVEQAQALLDAGESNRAVARSVGLSEGAVRLALGQGRLKRSRPAKGSARGKGPRERNDEDRQGTGGVAVKRNEERALAAVGELSEALPLFDEPQESVAKAGVLVALPALVSQGLYEVGRQVYDQLKNGYFGLNAVLSTLVLMALLRIRTVEQLPTHAPGEFGLVLGLDRAPEMKTLRRKLKELGARGKARELQAAFAEHWAQQEPELLGFLYVDGHVRPYNGRKHELPKAHVPRRRLCMAATTDYWVNDAFADPLFYVTAPGNEGLLAMLNEAVLPEVRELVDGERRITLVMDRECWSPKNFEDWSRKGFDVMTYRKGSYAPWPDEDFQKYQSSAPIPKPTVYLLAERPLTLSNGFEVREVRCLTENGHQTSVVTTRTDLSVLDIAERMFSRWQQENFFRYMRHEFTLDHLSTYDTEAANPERPVPNPAKKEKKKELGGVRKELAGLKQTYAESGLLNGDADGTEREALHGQIRTLEQHIDKLDQEHKALPTHVPVGETRDPRLVVQLEQERKILVDQIKMVAYRAETELAQLVGPLLGLHHCDEARAFLRQVFQLSADLVPDPSARTLSVRLHGMANWRSNRALAGLCTILNAYDTRYPGTDLRLVLEPPPCD